MKEEVINITTEMILAKGNKPFTDLDAAAIKAKIISQELGLEYAVVTIDGGFAISPLSSSHREENTPSATMSSTVERNDAIDEGVYLRPSPKSRFGSIVIASLGLMLAIRPGILVMIFGMDLGVPGWPDLLARFAGFGIALWMIIDILLYIYGHRYFFGPYGIEARVGIISRKNTRIEYKDIRNNDYDQNPVDLVLGVGDLKIYTAGSSVAEITMYGIDQPDDWQQQLKKRMQGLRV